MKKIQDKGRLIFTGALFVFTLTVSIASFSYTPAVRLVPIIVSVITLLLIIIAVVGEFYPGLLEILDTAFLDFEEKKEVTLLGKKGEIKGFLSQFAWLASYFLLVYFFGFLIATGLYILIFLRVYGKMGWTKSLLSAIAMFLITFSVFQVILKINLFEGVLFGALVPPI